jgi:hypothetical protein
MLPRRSALIVASAAGLFSIHACAPLGGVISKAAVVLCAFALMIGGPILILAWFGSLSHSDEKRRADRRRLEHEKADALLWQQTLRELQSSAWAPYPDVALMERNVADAYTAPTGEGKRTARPILALCLAAASAIGLAGCGGVAPEAWAMVRPGMGTAELVSLVGGPDYVRSNGNAEVWQYCGDFLDFDDGNYTRYYTAVLVDRQQVREVQPYAVPPTAGCEDFYRAEF